MRTADKKHNSSAEQKEVLKSDQTGTHKNNPFKIPPRNIEAVMEHIKSFPVMDSHYCREETKRKYLEEGLSVCKMFRMFSEDVVSENPDLRVSENMYRNIFNTKFYLGFFVPKKDREVHFCKVYFYNFLCKIILVLIFLI